MLTIAIITVCFAFAAVLACAVALVHAERLSAGRLIRESDRQARLREYREDMLLDRLAHAYDKPWAEPPAEPEPAREPSKEDGEELDYDLSYIGELPELEQLEETEGAVF